MTNKYIIPFLIVILISLVALIISTFEVQKSNVNLSKIKFLSETNLKLSNSKKQELKEKLVEYLNDNYYEGYNKITFLNNEFDQENNDKYFYALLNNEEKSLIEIIYKNPAFDFNYLSDSNTPNDVSTITGVSYLQIVNKKEYKKNLELEKIQKEAEKAAPDDVWPE